MQSGALGALAGLFGGRDGVLVVLFRVKRDDDDALMMLSCC